MRLTFIGADHEVTGSCHYLDACGKHILVDCGMEQGQDTFENAEIPCEAALIDYVFLTHAHIDHSGLIPLLYARGFRGQVFSTEATADLCSIMLRDSAHIQMSEAEWRNRKAKRSASVEEYVPLYTMQDADGVIKRIIPCRYNARIAVCEGIEIRFTDVGHLLGSAAVEVWLTEKEPTGLSVTRKIVFSGDVGNMDQPLIKDPSLVRDADYVLIESTYGDRLHTTEKPDYVGSLTKIIKETFDKGGNVVIPSFAVGRTQEILYFIRKIKQDNLIPEYRNFPVYVDSPLAVEATGMFNKNVYSCYDSEALELVNRGINPISFPGLSLSITSDESKAINADNDPKVIISASGMCEAGRVRHHLKHNLWRAESTILFVGFQAVGTLGRALVEGANEVKLFGEVIEVRANVTTLPGMSGHADKKGLIRFMQGFERLPRKVFVVHGEDAVCDAFAECLRTEYGMDTCAPYSGSTFDLVDGSMVYEAEPHRIAPKKARKAADVFDRLLAAGQRLLAVIRKNEGGANKDLAKFADQINSLCDKWDR